MAAVLVASGGLSIGLAGDAGTTTANATAGDIDSAVSAAAVRELRDSRQPNISRSSGSRTLRMEGEATRQARAELRAERRERAARLERQREEARRAAEARRQAAIQQAREWAAPLSGYRITATFGASSALWSTVHTGVDLAAPSGAPVTSIATGTVTFAGYDGSYGYKVIVQHADGTETWYAHLSAISASVGQGVTKTTVIGLVGSTGNSTGPHLHLEVRPSGGDPVDPITALAARGAHL